MGNVTIKDMHTIVRLDLTTFGRSTYKAYLDAEFDRTRSVPAAETHDHARRGTLPPSPLEVPLWEALRIFGPVTRTSTRLPFNVVEVQLEDSPGLVQAQQRCVELQQRCVKLQRLVMFAAEVIGLANGYTAPEIVESGMETLSRMGHPPAHPTDAGWWWRAGRPVLVSTADDGDDGDNGDNATRLVWNPGNGRCKDVDPGDPEWGGRCHQLAHKPPARPNRDSDEDEQDIPF